MDYTQHDNDAEVNPVYLIRSLTLLIVSLFAFATAAEEEKTFGLETGWLEFVKGHKGSTMGVEVREADAMPEGKGSRLVIAIPKVSMADPSQIEEVRVVGQAPEEIDFFPEFEYEWVDDYDNDFYGLVIRFSEDTKWPIRLFLDSDAGFVEP
ncbi:hypothetical protein [Parahalioglobus pacificus]|uniref:Uncharacterized protein n=1 Tax=Parahalioglobus pacificus TaxID=930806 RepID=A0A918XIC1_9GAMM|nr:hypothetical protein [Halioglobus pacificus]NQY03470.1 hypothetical protein [Halieaceae bacterium]GHD32110.1 hypothetical protein GCM10007053_15860 [Halioglobus pacificus]